MILLAALVNHSVGWHATELHDELELLLLVISGKYWLTSVQLSQDAAKTPDVNFFGVFDS